MHSDMPFIKMPGQAGIPFWNQKDIAEEKIKEIDPEGGVRTQKFFDFFRKTIKKSSFQSQHHLFNFTKF